MCLPAITSPSVSSYSPGSDKVQRYSESASQGAKRSTPSRYGAPRRRQGRVAGREKPRDCGQPLRRGRPARVAPRFRHTGTNSRWLASPGADHSTARSHTNWLIRWFHDGKWNRIPRFRVALPPTRTGRRYRDPATSSPFSCLGRMNSLPFADNRTNVTRRYDRGKSGPRSKK